MDIGLSFPESVMSCQSLPEKEMTKVVVLIERQITARRMLRFAMELQEYRVVEVENLVSVQSVLTGNSMDLLIIGIDAGDAILRELVDQVRQSPRWEDLPILLVGEPHLRLQWDVRMIGNCAWLDKPFRMGELHSLIESMVGSVPLPRVRNNSAPHGNQHA